MKKNRFIPYGYTMRNGKMVIEKTEAEVIRRIFSAYIDGASLKEIADELTAQQVPYTEKKTEWFKGRISRILENRKYCGNAEFDKIIDDETFMEAFDAKSARQVAIPGDLDVEIYAVKNRVRCIRCGSIMTRKVEKRCRIKAVWSCTNPNCGCRQRIDDATLLDRVMILIARVKANENLLESSHIEQSKNMTLIKCENDLEQELNRQQPDEDVILNHIMMIAAQEYASTTAEQDLLRERIKKALRRIEIKKGFDKQAFDLIVKTILLGDDSIKIAPVITRSSSHTISKQSPDTVIESNIQK